MKLREMAQLLAASLALVLYVYVIGWLITSARLSAARLPAQASLPLIDDKTILATGVRSVIVMAFVFAAMCLVAYGLHAFTWDSHAPQWHALVRLGRSNARTLTPPPVPPSETSPDVAPGSGSKVLKAPEPSTLGQVVQAKMGDPFVRVVAGFNVVVLAGAFGLVVARIIKPLIDQVDADRWWALLAPWAIVTLVVALILVRVNPLRGGRFAHTLLWTFVVLVACVSMAPIGLLLLTWAGIATVGRAVGRRQVRPTSKVEFALSPLPWLLLTVYALVGLSYYATPPVSFPQAIVTGPHESQVGGYLAQRAGAVYLVSCTALADATSTDEEVLTIASAQATSVATKDTQFSVDSGARPSLPTLLLHALGIQATTPTWIRPELRPKTVTCAGEQPPAPSSGYRDASLGEGVIAGPAPPFGRAAFGEPPIQQTTPAAIAALARRYQPTVLVTVADRFWPVSVGALLQDIGTGGAHTCLYRKVGLCAIRPPKLTDLRPQGSTASEFLQYPASLSGDPTGQFRAFLRGQSEPGESLPSTHAWLADPGLLNPWRTAQVYFYYAGPSDPAHWPASNHTIPAGLVALQYWFFYPYNYYPTVATPDLMNGAPLAGDLVNTDLHQGDWEHVTVLLDPKTGKPAWLYTARHSDEGHYYPWNSPLLTFDEGHPVVQAAFGGHPTYDAHCGVRPRYAHGLSGDVGDWVVCGSGRFAFRAATTPLVDIATTPWACWKGHFGTASASEVNPAKNEGSVQLAIDQYYEVAGPRSPLWQAENGHLAVDYKQPRDTGVCARGADPRTAELQAARVGAPSPASH